MIKTGKEVDITGMKFNMLTAVEKVGCIYYGGHRFTQWLCKCECGGSKIVTVSALRTGNVKSCGCLKEKRNMNLGDLNRTHGKSKTRLYVVWKQIRKRCYNKNDTVYKYYGGKGVTVCDEWNKNYEPFAKWAMENGYDENAKRGECTLDRINPFLGYSPDNCRWVPMKEQLKNTRKEWVKFENNNRHQGEATCDK